MADLQPAPDSGRGEKPWPAGRAACYVPAMTSADPHRPDLAAALDLIRRSGFATGPEWEAAHKIAQAHEGETAFDAVHALLHRIEGDAANAAYWDRRAGTGFGGEGFEAELARLAAHFRVT